MSITAVPLKPVKRGIVAYIWVGIVAALVLATVLAFHGTAEVVANKGSDAQFLAWNKTRPGVIETASGLQYEVLNPGADAVKPKPTDVAGVMYVGKLRDGTVFDASQQPVPFPLSGGAIPGFLEGMSLMSKGSRYRFWMKPSLAYGDRSPDPSKIPNGAMLIFDVEMIGFVDEATLRQMRQQQMQQQQMMQQQGGAGGPPPGAGAPPPGAAPEGPPTGR